ncbi:MAG: hypothetical protein QOG15_379 [Solirubrobacteraceae bacterium]|jgi:hypothetical protein|nr:hypothetical protein [Solirubrobacteraceae bacterium]
MELSKFDEQEGCAACGHEHLVSFYENEESLVATVVEYVVPALRGYDAAIVVATAEHSEAIADGIRLAGIDIDMAVRDGRYQVHDATELLSRFMAGGGPDPARFRVTIEAILNRAGDRHVRVYGEMVALLWAEGDVTSTIALEDLWNHLVAEHGFALFCGYPISGFDVQSRTVFEHICGQHSSARRP